MSNDHEGHAALPVPPPAPAGISALQMAPGQRSLVVANSHHYFKHLNGVKPVISAVLGVVLWPLVLFGVNLHIK